MDTNSEESLMMLKYAYFFPCLFGDKLNFFTFLTAN